MSEKFTDEALKELAAQLRCPNGEKGRAMATRMYQTNTDMLRQSLPFLELKGEHHILEIGHASCKHLDVFFDVEPDIIYYGLEKSKAMYQEAQKNQAAYVASGKAQFFLSESESLPFAGEMFERVITVNTLYFLADPLQFFKEIYQVLTVDGLFVLTFQAKDFIETLPFIQYGFSLYDVIEVRQLLEEANFKIIAEEHFSEETISKVGELVERKYIVIKTQKVV